MTSRDLFGTPTPEAVKLLDAATVAQRVHRATRKGSWWTLRELSKVTGATEAQVKAALGFIQKQERNTHAIETWPQAKGSTRYRKVALQKE